MRLKQLVFGCAFVSFMLLARSGAAQTPTFKLAWDQPEALAITQTYQYTLKVDALAAVAVTPTCVANGLASKCTAPLTPLVSGQHTLVLSVYNGFGSASSDPLSGGPPSKPIIVSVTVTVTIP